MIIGRSQIMQAVYELVKKVSRTSSNVLISGETGTGKELIAREIHTLSERRYCPFVAVNCGAIPPGLAESEFFGHEKGAFTGACSRKIGRFEYANGGILFLDEVSSMPKDMQAKLLRALQERRVERVGSNASVKFDVRVIAASNECLECAMKEGGFREDLYYRLKVVTISLPPLRERAGDIPLLAGHFLQKIGGRYNKELKGISPEALRLLMDYSWPGNVRELENLIERMAVVSEEGREMTPEDIPPEFFGLERACVDGQIGTFREASEKFERVYITGVLKRTGWNVGRAAGLMDVHRNTLFLKMKRLGIICNKSGGTGEELPSAWGGASLTCMEERKSGNPARPKKCGRFRRA